MFSKDVVHSGKFLDMPISTQALYFHLGMIADDDGYAEYKTAMKLCGASTDDIKVLSAKEFIKVFDEYVLIVKQWDENNYIQKDRYKQSRYLNVYKMDKECIHNGNTGKVRLGKDRLYIKAENKFENIKSMNEIKEKLADKLSFTNTAGKN